MITLRTMRASSSRGGYFVDRTDAGRGDYYPGGAERPGRWIVLGASVIPGIDDADDIDAATFERALSGLDKSGATLLRRQRADHVSGVDICFNPPKCVAALWACGNALRQPSSGSTVRAVIDEILSEAGRQVLGFAFERDLFLSRRGAGGTVLEPAAGILSTEFPHSTSRLGDPQRHNHHPTINIARRQDGSVGTLETAPLYEWQGPLSALDHVAVADALQKRLNIPVMRDGKNFQILGIPDQVLKVWSKRRDEIEDAAEEAGFTTADHRAWAGVLALKTRRSKKHLPTREALEERWDRELSALGLTREALLRAVYNASDLGDDLRPSPMEELSAELAGKEVVEERDLWQAAALAILGRGGLADVKALVERVLDERRLAPIGCNRWNHPVYAAPSTIGLVHGLVADAVERIGSLVPAPQHAVDTVLADYNARLADEGGALTPAQAEAITHVWGADGVSLITGFAGTGKSTTTQAMVDVAKRSGIATLGLAPTGAAEEVLRRESGLPKTMTVQMAALQIRNGASPLPVGGLVLIDEVGMVGNEDMAPLLREARRVGARVVLLGDGRQFEPVPAGNPLSLLERYLGTAACLRDIRRQRVEWQRHASLDLAEGRVAAALGSYDAHGAIIWAKSAGAALDQLSAEWLRDLERHPQGTRLVLAARNADVRQANLRLRAGWRQASRLSGEDIVVRTMPRGSGAKPVDLPLASGDRIIFGESIKALGIKNADMAIVEKVTDGPGGVYLTVKLDRGPTLHAPLKQFRGYRKPRDKTPPRIQHAYAVTGHAAQGATVDRTFLLSTSPLDARAAYVAMTRHRWGCTAFVDESRLRVAVEAMRAIGDATRATPEELREQLYREASRYRVRPSICDFLPPPCITQADRRRADRDLAPTSTICTVSALNLVRRQPPRIAAALHGTAITPATQRCIGDVVSALAEDGNPIAVTVRTLVGRIVPEPSSQSVPEREPCNVPEFGNHVVPEQECSQLPLQHSATAMIRREVPTRLSETTDMPETVPVRDAPQHTNRPRTRSSAERAQRILENARKSRPSGMATSNMGKRPRGPEPPER